MIIYMYTLHQTMPKEPIINHYNSLSITSSNTRINSQGKGISIVYRITQYVFIEYISVVNNCSVEGVLVLRQEPDALFGIGVAIDVAQRRIF